MGRRSHFSLTTNSASFPSSSLPYVNWIRFTKKICATRQAKKKKDPQNTEQRVFITKYKHLRCSALVRRTNLNKTRTVETRTISIFSSISFISSGFLWKILRYWKISHNLLVVGQELSLLGYFILFHFHFQNSKNVLKKLMLLDERVVLMKRHFASR